MARTGNRFISRQQVVSLLAALGITEDEMDLVKSVEVDAFNVRITRSVRVEGGILAGGDYVEDMPIDWRKRTETAIVGERGPELTS